MKLHLKEYAQVWLGVDSLSFPPRRPFYFPIDSGFTPAKKCQFDNGRTRDATSSIFLRSNRLISPYITRGASAGHAFTLHTVLKSFGGKAHKDGQEKRREEAPLSIIASTVVRFS